jgi:hypothetical protein
VAGENKAIDSFQVIRRLRSRSWWVGFPTDFRTVLFLLHLVIFLAGILAFSPHTYTGFDDAFGQNHGGSDYHCHSGLAALFWIGGDYILRKPVVPPESKMESDESA